MFNRSRRTILQNALLAVGALSLPRLAASSTLRVENITQLYSVDVALVATPKTIEELVSHVRSWPGKIAIGGGRYSMGGQIAINGGLHIDMRQLARVVWFRHAQKIVRVQAGMTWRDLQELIDPFGLAVKIMQSYSNFTVGGSVSVNCHGRYVGAGSVANSVRALSLVLADGTIREVTANDDTGLFRAAIGGYAACAVIAEVELELVDNSRMERHVKQLPIAEYFSYFLKDIKRDPNAIMHNVDLLPPQFSNAVSVTWKKTDEPATDNTKLTPRDQQYSVKRDAIWLLTEVPGISSVRSSVTPSLLKVSRTVKWRNHEASLDVASLEPRTRKISTYALQEYFLPVETAQKFASELAALNRSSGAELLNVSIRHSPQDDISLMPWAKTEVFSFVLYYKQRTNQKAISAVAAWTRKLIALALSLNGRYYLPYQLHATREQFWQAYPEAATLKAIKSKVDPNGKFSNQLIEKYL